MKGRRYCQISFTSKFLDDFDESSRQITLKGCHSQQILMSKGIEYLEKITYDYLASQERDLYTFQPFHTLAVNPYFQQNFAFQKQELKASIQPNEFEETKKSSNIKKNFAKSQKKVKISETEELRQSIKKISLEDVLEMDQNLNQNTNSINISDLNKKSLIQLIEETAKKHYDFKKASEASKKDKQSSSDSSYPLTLYSSNESSNDQNDHEEQFRQQLNANLTDPSSSLLSRNSKSSSKNQSSNIIDSPRKSRSKRKRLYMGAKRIPRWAQNLDQVVKQVINQANDPKYNPLQIYGNNVVQRLDTNVILGFTKPFNRGSSAKWKRGAYQFVI